MIKIDQQVVEKDITVYCIPALSFPEGILEAHQELHKKVPYSPLRNYVGVSRPGLNGKIHYKAGAGELEPGELKTSGLEQWIIPAGIYLRTRLNNYRHNLADIHNHFQVLLSQKNIHPQGFCLEWYINDNDMNCLVPLEKPQPST